MDIRVKMTLLRLDLVAFAMVLITGSYVGLTPRPFLDKLLAYEIEIQVKDEGILLNR